MNKHLSLFAPIFFFGTVFSAEPAKKTGLPPEVIARALIKTEQENSNKIIEETSLYDLNIISKTPESLSIADLLTKKTKTYFGKITIENILAKPTSNRETISMRQAFIKNISADKKIIQSLEKELTEIASVQDFLLGYYDEESDFHKNLSSFYFSNNQEFRLPYFSKPLFSFSWGKKLNENPVALELYRRWKIVKEFSYLGYLIGAAPIAAYAKYNFWNSRKQAVAESRGDFRFSDNQPIAAWSDIIRSSFVSPVINAVKELDPRPYLYKETINYDMIEKINRNDRLAQQATYGDSLISYKYLFYKDNQTFLKYSIPLAVAVYYYYNSYKHYADYSKDIKNYSTDILNQNQPIYDLKKELVLLKRFTQALERLSKTVGIDLISFLGKESEESAKKVTQLMNLLNSFSTENESQWFTYGGNALIAHRLLQEIKLSLIPLFHLIGELDSYLALAKLINSSDIKKGAYCLVSFSDSANPELELTNFWHPVVTKKEPVNNSISLGGKDNPRGVILTGPNNCGKSTNMKGVAISLLLAQTFGIAAAEKAHLSIFSQFNIYINNSQDNIAEGWGAFKAEKEAVANISQKVQTLSKDQFSFTLLDEAFKGTVAEECEDRVFNFGKEIAHYPNAVALIATHGKLPMELEKVTHGAYQNYQVELIETNTGEFIRTHKLIRSRNNWWFDDKLKRQRFLETV